MQVEILKTDKRLGIKAGERYEVTSYQDDKFILESRIPDGYDPECTQYRYEVKVIT